jgi:hypothetical protein
LGVIGLTHTHTHTHTHAAYNGHAGVAEALLKAGCKTDMLDKV